MGRKYKTKLFAEVGPLKKGDDGFYREKGGHIVICKSCPETWYRPDEPGTQEEQWEEIEAAFRLNGIVNTIIFGGGGILFILYMISVWGC